MPRGNSYPRNRTGWASSRPTPLDNHRYISPQTEFGESDGLKFGQELIQKDIFEFLCGVWRSVSQAAWGPAPKPPGFWEAWARVFKVLVCAKVVL
jgi:hypothetical protein